VTMKKDTTGQLPVMNYTQTQGSQVYCRSRHVCSLFFRNFYFKIKICSGKKCTFHSIQSL